MRTGSVCARRLQRFATFHFSQSRSSEPVTVCSLQSVLLLLTEGRNSRVDVKGTKTRQTSRTERLSETSPVPAAVNAALRPLRWKEVRWFVSHDDSDTGSVCCPESSSAGCQNQEVDVKTNLSRFSSATRF